MRALGLLGAACGAGAHGIRPLHAGAARGRSCWESGAVEAAGAVISEARPAISGAVIPWKRLRVSSHTGAALSAALVGAETHPWQAGQGRGNAKLSEEMKGI